MRAKKIVENLNFERGQNPKSTMGLGLYKKIKEECIEYEWIDNPTDEDLLEWAAYENKADYVEFLLKYGVNPFKKKDWYTVILALDSKNESILDILIPFIEESGYLKGLINYIKRRSKIATGRKIPYLLRLKDYFRSKGKEFPELNETYNFERRMDPKKAIGLGKLQQILDECEETGWAGNPSIDDALAWASFTGNENYVKYLLEAGADPSDDAWDAVLSALYENRYNILDLLIPLIDLRDLEKYILKTEKEEGINPKEGNAYNVLQDYLSKRDLGDYSLKESMDFERGQDLRKLLSQPKIGDIVIEEFDYSKAIIVILSEKSNNFYNAAMIGSIKKGHVFPDSQLFEIDIEDVRFRRPTIEESNIIKNFDRWEKYKSNMEKQLKFAGYNNIKINI